MVDLIFKWSAGGDGVLVWVLLFCVIFCLLTKPYESSFFFACMKLELLFGDNIIVVGSCLHVFRNAQLVHWQIWRLMTNVAWRLH